MVQYTDDNTAVEIFLQANQERIGWCRIDVRDHGRGVPTEMLTKLFEPFVRVDNARDRKRGGYGLGLAIAERTIRLHGGEILAQNEVGGGLRVSISLPIDKNPRIL